MKKLIFSFCAMAATMLAAGTLFNSCEKVGKDSAEIVEAVPEGSSRVTFVFPQEAATKAGVEATTAEKTINSLRIFVYDKNHKLEQDVQASNITVAGDKTSATASIIITNGQKYFRAIANAGTSYAPTVGTSTDSDFDNQISLLADNGASSLVMVATASQEVLSDVNVNMSLTRLCSKVCLTKILRNFSDADLAKLELKVKAIKITNVAGRIYWGGSALAESAVSTWYNKLGAMDSAVSSLTANDITDVTIANGGSISPDYAFYVYSNPSSVETRGGSWSTRKSRMVIEVGMAGMTKTQYYVADLPQTAANQVYNVELTVTGMPSEDIEGTTAGTLDLNVTASITVANWGSTTSVPISL